MKSEKYIKELRDNIKIQIKQLKSIGMFGSLEDVLANEREIDKLKCKVEVLNKILR